MIGIFRGQQLCRLAVHRLAIEMAEVRIAAALLADALVIEHAAGFIDAHQLRDVAFAAGQLALLLAGLEIVQIQLAPVVALRKPDRFVRTGERLPVDPSVAGFEERLTFLLEHFADGAGSGVGHAQVGLLMVARRRDERHLAAVGAPLHVDPLTAALHVVAER